MAEVKERVEQYLYSPSRPSWPVLGRTLPLPTQLFAREMSQFALFARYGCVQVKEHKLTDFKHELLGNTVGPSGWRSGVRLDSSTCKNSLSRNVGNGKAMPWKWLKASQTKKTVTKKNATVLYPRVFYLLRASNCRRINNKHTVKVRQLNKNFLK